MDFVLTDRLYNVQRYRNYDHAELDVLGSDEMEDIAKVLRDVLQPGRQRYVLCYALQFSFCYKTLMLENEEDRVRSRENVDEDPFQSEKRKCIEQRPTFEVNNSALLFFSCGLGLLTNNGRETCRATSAIEMSIHHKP